MVEQTPPEVASVISAFQADQEARRRQQLREAELMADANYIYKGVDNSIHRYGVSCLVSPTEILKDSGSKLIWYRQTPWIAPDDSTVEYSLGRGRKMGVLMREKGSTDEQVIFHVSELEIKDWNGQMEDYSGTRATVDFISRILHEEYVPVDSAHHPSQPAQGVPQEYKFADLPEKYRPKTLSK